MLRAEEVLKGKCSQCGTTGEQGLPVSMRIDSLACRGSLRGRGRNECGSSTARKPTFMKGIKETIIREKLTS